MARRRWPRKNDADSIRVRQDALREPVGDDGEVFWGDLEPWRRAQESLTGVAVIPVGVVELDAELGEYELDAEGAVRELGRSLEHVYVPLAHTEGGLSASMQRGAKAAAESGGFRTYVLHDRITRASCFVCTSAGTRWRSPSGSSPRSWSCAHSSTASTIPPSPSVRASAR